VTWIAIIASGPRFPSDTSGVLLYLVTGLWTGPRIPADQLSTSRVSSESVQYNYVISRFQALMKASHFRLLAGVRCSPIALILHWLSVSSVL
jgi:hypothetical protein